LTGAAQKELDKLPKKSAAKILEALRELRDEPRPHGCKKLVGTKNTFRIRVGDYRVVYEVRWDKRHPVSRNEPRCLEVRLRFLVRVFREGDDYSAMVPRLPGGIAAGSSVPELRKLITKAIWLHVDMMRRSGQERNRRRAIRLVRSATKSVTPSKRT
jgi:mRNA-degrading endonuclease RelE of RelBE toxin-antitoxin system/predicted RNase H-like HicB family nuclease